VYFQRFFEPKLASASYLIGCQKCGDAIVIDANRDIDQYVDAAAAYGLTIAYATETHIHADFVSGTRALAARTGAQVLLPALGDYAFPGQPLADGDRIMVGNVQIDVMHTPGHTPEHIIFLLTDTATTSRPWGALTGDFLFVGDVGRPDLLERAANVRGSAESGARALFASLRRLRALPVDLQIWPGHGAGSACGKALGAMPTTTLGYELATNWALQQTDEEAFVRAVLSGQPEPPRYFAIMKRVNRAGPDRESAVARPPRMPDAALGPLLDAKATMIDLRRADAFAAAHIPGTINVPLTRAFPTWAGSVLPYDGDLYLIGDDERATIEATHDLARIGLDRVAGRFTRQVIDRWRNAGGAIATVAQIDARALADALQAGKVAVLDVRDESEWDTGHLAEAIHLPLATLAARLDEVPRGRPIVVHCQAGSRSAIAASLLTASGIPDVLNMTGGIAAWSGPLVHSGHDP
jgi:hydroxyacylglutathione hydrolase